MSSYDPDDDDGWGTARTVGATVLGGLAGRTLGRAAGGKTGKLAKNGGLTAKQLRARRLANAGTFGGAAGAATLANLDNESVRDTLNRVLEARDAAGPAIPYAFPAATAAILGRGVYKTRAGWKKLGNEVYKGAGGEEVRKPMTPKELRNFALTNAKYMGGAGVVGQAGKMIAPIKHEDDR